MNMSRRAQAEIIVTILIILLVLAAIVIVWQVISTTVTSGAKEIPGQTDCLIVKLDINSATSSYCINSTDNTRKTTYTDKTSCENPGFTWNLGTLTLRRGVGTGKLAGVNVYINGAKNGSGIDFTANPLAELDQKGYPYELKSSDNVKVAKVIGDSMSENNRLCDFTDNSVDGVIVKAS